LSSVHYAVSDPSTSEELDARIYKSLHTAKRQFKVTVIAELDELSRKRGDVAETKVLKCVIFDHHPTPTDDYFVIASIPKDDTSIRIDKEKGMLKATVFANDAALSS